MTWWAIGFTFLTFYGIHTNRQLGEQGREAHDALCVFRSDLADRRDQTQKLLDEQPDADPVVVYGLRIPRDQLESNVKNQNRSVEALLTLDCVPPLPREER